MSDLIDGDGLPYLPYGGTSGASGSDASYERAEREDASGVTSFRQRLTLKIVGESGQHGTTVVELREQTGWHHGKASSVLSTLHKVERLARLKDKRQRCQIYVLPDNVAGRLTEPQGRR